MKYALFYESAENFRSRAPDLVAAHRVRWQEFHGQGTLLMIGPFADVVGDAMAIFATREAAEEMDHGDPFVQHGVVQSGKIREGNEALVPSGRGGASAGDTLAVNQFLLSLTRHPVAGCGKWPSEQASKLAVTPSPTEAMLAPPWPPNLPEGARGAMGSGGDAIQRIGNDIFQIHLPTDLPRRRVRALVEASAYLSNNTLVIGAVHGRYDHADRSAQLRGRPNEPRCVPTVEALRCRQAIQAPGDVAPVPDLSVQAQRFVE